MLKQKTGICVYEMILYIYYESLKQPIIKTNHLHYQLAEMYENSRTLEHCIYLFTIFELHFTSSYFGCKSLWIVNLNERKLLLTFMLHIKTSDMFQLYVNIEMVCVLLHLLNLNYIKAYFTILKQKTFCVSTFVFANSILFLFILFLFVCF